MEQSYGNYTHLLASTSCDIYNRRLQIAIEPDEYLQKSTSKRTITAKKFNNYQTMNIVAKQVENNKKCFKIPKSKTPQYLNSFSIKHIDIVEPP